jgi:hypothetical protein
VGFVSSYFRHHTVGKLLVGLVAGLPRPRFWVGVYNTLDKTGVALARVDGLTATFRCRYIVMVVVAALAHCNPDTLPPCPSSYTTSSLIRRSSADHYQEILVEKEPFDTIQRQLAEQDLDCIVFADVAMEPVSLPTHKLCAHTLIHPYTIRNTLLPCTPTLHSYPTLLP